MIYLSSNSGELFKQVLLLNPLDMFALANLLCPSLALSSRSRPPPPKFFHSVPSPDSCFSKERGTSSGWMPEETLRKLHADGGVSWLRSRVPQHEKIPLIPLRVFFTSERRSAERVNGWHLASGRFVKYSNLGARKALEQR